MEKLRRLSPSLNSSSPVGWPMACIWPTAIKRPRNTVRSSSDHQRLVSCVAYSPVWKFKYIFSCGTFPPIGWRGRSATGRMIRLMIPMRLDSGSGQHYCNHENSERRRAILLRANTTEGPCLRLCLQLHTYMIQHQYPYGLYTR